MARAGLGWNVPRLKILELSLTKFSEIAMKSITGTSGTGQSARVPVIALGPKRDVEVSPDLFRRFSLPARAHRVGSNLRRCGRGRGG